MVRQIIFLLKYRKLHIALCSLSLHNTHYTIPANNKKQLLQIPL